MNNLVAAPVVLPLVTGIILLFWRRQVSLQRWVSAASVLAGLLLSLRLTQQVLREGIQPFYAGDWAAPFGITLVADLLSSGFVVLSMAVALVVLFFSFHTLDRGREEHYYYALFQFLLVGVNGSFLTGDIFNLFVFFEVLLIASYVLVALGGRPYQLLEGTKYVAINVIASAVFLVGVAALYRTMGTLNMADLALRAREVPDPGWLTVIGILFLIVFGTKAAIFPLYFWLPRSYLAPPAAIIAFFGGFLTKVGVYALIRTFTLIFVQDLAYTHHTLLMIIAGLTMVLGILGAIAQADFRRILSYHIISQIGYMIMGLAIFTPLAVAGAIIYVAHQMIVKSCLFLTSGVAEEVTGTSSLKKMGGLLTTHPLYALLFFTAAMALAGVPPLSGFFAKFVLVREGFAEGRYLIVAVALAVSIGTLFSMIKIYRYAFWGEVKGERRTPTEGGSGMLWPVAALVILAIGFGLGFEWVLSYALASARQLLDPDVYIRAVLARS